MITAGEATIRLLSRYGVDTVFGIPGVHTLEFCRGLAEGSAVRHIQARNEMGAGFMADGYARTTGRPGVALTISGPGVTNAATALGQAYGDSIPLLLISAEASSASLGKGWGVLHEVTDLNAVTRPLTALSACARFPSDIPDLLAQAFTIFRSQRPRPVHISIPVDILATLVEDNWKPVAPPAKPKADADAISAAAQFLQDAMLPVILTGGGAADADVTALAERLGALVMCSNAGKGIVPDGHPLCLGGILSRHEGQRVLSDADVILAIGTELSETDSYIEKLRIDYPLIRIDIDPRKINDKYPATVGIVSDAQAAVASLLEALGDGARTVDRDKRVAQTLNEIPQNLTASEQKHIKLLNVIRKALPDDAVVMGDACQVTYTASFGLPVKHPRRWHYAAGYCTLGYAFPLAVGAKIAQPDTPVLAIAGDGGSMFTIQELVTAAEQKLPIPLIVWHNNGYQQIRDDMRNGNFPRVGVDGLAPDFLALAKAMHCNAVQADSEEMLTKNIQDAQLSDRPTIIVVSEDSDWLT